jgi:hypothetical protein
MDAMNAATISLDCACGALHELPVDTTFQSGALRCRQCGETTYWKHCEECGAFTSVADASAPCPHCGPIDPAAVTPRGSPWSVFAVTCPWCRHPFNFLRHFSFSFFRCPHCRRYCRASGSDFVRVLAAMSVWVGLVALLRYSRPGFAQAFGESLAEWLTVVLLAASFLAPLAVYRMLLDLEKAR